MLKCFSSRDPPKAVLKTLHLCVQFQPSEVKKADEANAILRAETAAEEPSLNPNGKDVSGLSRKVQLQVL